MNIRVDPSLSVPVFQQIVDEVKSVIARGACAPGEMIPSVRQMAAQALINPNTVARAYRDLEREGIVTTRRVLAFSCPRTRRSSAGTAVARTSARNSKTSPPKPAAPASPARNSARRSSARSPMPTRAQRRRKNESRVTITGWAVIWRVQGAGHSKH